MEFLGQFGCAIVMGIAWFGNWYHDFWTGCNRFLETLLHG